MLINRLSNQTVDIVIFVIANLVNFLIVGVFLARSRGLSRVEWVLGLIVVSMIFPVGAAVIFNSAKKREWWTVVLPLLLILFCLVELMLDYILKLDFRNTPLRWPYITIFYLAMMGLIGYSFLIGRVFGYITLSTYFLNLLATWYSHSGQ